MNLVKLVEVFDSRLDLQLREVAGGGQAAHREYQGPFIQSFKHWQQKMEEALGDEPFPTLKRAS